MDLKSLRRLIREEVESVMDEAEGAASGPPQTFQEFKERLIHALTHAGAEQAAQGMCGHENSDEGITPELETAWRDMSAEMSDSKHFGAKHIAELWPELVDYYVYDAIVVMTDDTDLARAVCDAMK